MRLFAQILASGLIVAGVLWWMWRLPRRSDAWLTIAPWLALGSAWLSLASVVSSAGLWWASAPDWLVTVVFLLLDPGAIGAGVLVLWVHRDWKTWAGDDAQTVARQRQQAWVGIALGLTAVAIGYVYVMTHKRIFTPVGM